MRDIRTVLPLLRRHGLRCWVLVWHDLPRGARFLRLVRCEGPPHLQVAVAG